MVRTIAIAALLLAAPSLAHANPEPNAINDARAMGVGGSSVSFVNNPSALFANPAGLDHIDSFAGSIVITPLFVNLRSPFAGVGSEQDSGIIVAPLLFAGGAGRIHERLTIGAGAYVLTGFGGGFDDVDRVDDGVVLDPPQDQRVFLLVWEAAVPVSFRVSDELRLGVSLRLPFARMEVDSDQEVLPSRDNSGYRRVAQSVSGVGIPGVLLGVQWRPTRHLALGFVYRSKVRIDMDGETTLALIGDTPGSFDTSTEWFVPHMFRLGASVHLMDDRLMVTGEWRMQFHREANESQIFRVDIPGPLGRIEAPFEWRNVVVAGFGAEYWALPERFAVRTGVSMGTSATPAWTVTPFTPPPGFQTAIYGGLAYHAGPLELDLAGLWGFGSARLRTAYAGCDPDERIKVGCPGSYAVDSYFVSLGVTYRR